MPCGKSLNGFIRLINYLSCFLRNSFFFRFFFQNIFLKKPSCDFSFLSLLCCFLVCKAAWKAETVSLSFFYFYFRFFRWFFSFSDAASIGRDESSLRRRGHFPQICAFQNETEKFTIFGPFAFYEFYELVQG